jgi:hypothetical protein
MAKIKIEKRSGKTETVYGKYNNDTGTIKTGNREIHPSSQDRVTVSSGGCFIATEVYGGIDKPQVIILREYRDKVIIPQGYIGRIFVKSYYKVGPSLATIVRKIPILKSITRKILDKIATKCHSKLNSKEFNSSKTK